MALKLKLNEIMLFEEKAGIPLSRAQAEMAPAICQMHRLRTFPSAAERGAAIAACEECRPAMPSMRIIAAFGWLLRRRREPELTWDAFIETTDLEDVLADMGELEGVELPSPSSPPTLASGSLPSSMSIPA